LEKKRRTRFPDSSVACCPYCGSAEFKKDGIASDRQRFRCKGCHRTFTALTGTFLANTKKSEKAWQRYVLFLTNDLTIKASGEIGNVNRNTSYLWRRKIFSCLDSYEKTVRLSGTIWFDEMYFNVSKSAMITKENGNRLKGISRNKIAVEVGIDSSGKCCAEVLGKGKPTGKEILEAFRGHLEKRSTLVHDAFHGHSELVKAEGKKEIRSRTGDSDNRKLLQPINMLCSLISRVVYLHIGERRINLQHYINWACLRVRLNSMKPKKRKEFVLSLCRKTGSNYKRKRHRKRTSAH